MVASIAQNRYFNPHPNSTAIYPGIVAEKDTGVDSSCHMYGIRSVLHEKILAQKGCTDQVCQIPESEVAQRRLDSPKRYLPFMSLSLPLQEAFLRQQTGKDSC